MTVIKCEDCMIWVFLLASGWRAFCLAAAVARKMSAFLVVCRVMAVDSAVNISRDSPQVTYMCPESGRVFTMSSYG